MSKFSHVLLIDIDGLRADIFDAALKDGRIPHIAQLLGGPEVARGAQIPVLAPAPSITFCSQACLFTGTHPSEHGIPGNQFFDRFGTYGDGTPRHYAFDVGDTLAADGAVRVFTDGLVVCCLQAPTLYQSLAERGWRSVVAGNMYATGADTWLKPSLTDLARFTKGGNLFGLSAAEYDRRILENTLDYLDESGLPEVLTIHFLGLDHESHVHGPNTQMAYLVDHLDPLIGELRDAISTLPATRSPLPPPRTPLPPPRSPPSSPTTVRPKSSPTTATPCHWLFHTSASWVISSTLWAWISTITPAKTRTATPWWPPMADWLMSTCRTARAAGPTPLISSAMFCQLVGRSGRPIQPAVSPKKSRAR
ncbi:MAG: alkaline phosphatase family protein [Anaerolineales bacterium]|nr:alkaline phosphatase family protein [Anaerolineales bacterium]